MHANRQNIRKHPRQHVLQTLTTQTDRATSWKKTLQIHKTTAEGFPVAIWCWTRFDTLVDRVFMYQPFKPMCWADFCFPCCWNFGFVSSSSILHLIYNQGPALHSLTQLPVFQCFWCVHLGGLFLQYEGFAGCLEMASSGPLFCDFMMLRKST